MKHLILPLLLCLSLLLCACGETAETEKNPTQDTILQLPQLEEMSVVPHEDCTMELHFTEELPVGAVVEVWNKDLLVLTHTVEASTLTLRLSDEALHPDVSYSLKVNGVLQQHSGAGFGRPGDMKAPPEDIPIPTQPIVPEMPEGEAIGGFTPGDSGNIGSIAPSEGYAPAEGFTINMELPADLPIGSLPAEPPEISDIGDIPSFSGLPTGSISSAKAPTEPNPTEFRLRGAMTAFYTVGPAN